MNSNFSNKRTIIIFFSLLMSLFIFIFHNQQLKADAAVTSATSWEFEKSLLGQLQSETATYYVSPAGNDNNPGTSTELPWRTIQKAANTVLAGDVVSIREGIYDERVSFYQAGDQVGGTERHSVSRVSLTEGNKATFETSISVSIGDYLYVYRSWKSNNGVYKITGFGDNYVTVEGTPFLDETSNVIASIATPIIFKNYPGETVTLNPNRSSDAIIFGSWGSNPEPTDGADYIIIDGINVTKSDGSGVIFLHSNHNVIRNAKIYGNDAPGVAIWRGSTFNTIENNEIFENGFDQPGEGVYIGKSYEYDGSDYNQVISNYLHHPGPAGECAETKWDIRGTVFEGNRFEGCGYNGGLWLNPGSTETLVYNNIFENDPQSQFHIYLRGPANIIFNNLISDAQRGIFIEGNYLNNQIYHNVFYNNEVGIRFPYSEAYRIEIKNNILSGNSKQISGPTDNAIIDYNVFNGPSDTFGTNPILDNPEFVNPTTSDFHLQSSSPAIDAGVALAEALNDYEGNPRPQGNGFDMGAFEYVVATDQT